MQIKRLAINTSSNVSVTVLKIIFAFIMTPILVENLLYHDYGIWEICVSVIGYMGIMDLGLRPAITRHVAMYSSENKCNEVKYVYSSSFFFMLLLGIISFTTFLAWALIKPELLAEDGQNIERYTWLLIIIGGQLFVKFPGIAAEAALDGFHKYYLKNNITIVNTIIGNAIIFCYITPENALLLVAGVSTIGLSIKYLIFIAILAKSKDLGEIPNRNSFDLNTLLNLIKFGSKSLVQGICWRIEQSITPLLIAFFLAPSLIIFYTIPANLVGYLKTLTANLTQALLPYFSENIKQGLEQKQNIYQTLTKYIGAIIMPIHIGLFLLGEAFISLWLDTEISTNARGLLYVLIFANFINAIDPLASKFLTAENKHGIFAKLAPIGVTINVIITTIALYFWGIEGATLGALIQTVIFAPIYFVYRSKTQGSDTFTFFKNVYGSLVAPLFILGIAISILRGLWGVDTFVSFTAVVSVSTTLYILAFYAFSLSPHEKDYLHKKLNRK